MKRKFVLIHKCKILLLHIWISDYYHADTENSACRKLSVINNAAEFIFTIIRA